MLLFIGLHLHEKKYWWDIDDQRILKSGWMRTFWHIAHEPKFSQIWSLHKKTEHCNVFRFRLLPRNVMTKCHEKSKNSILGPFRPLLGRTRIFLANRLLSFFFCFAKFQEKTNEQIPRKMGYRHTCVRTNMNSYELPC